MDQYVLTRFTKDVLRLFDPWSNFEHVQTCQGCTSTSTYDYGCNTEIYRLIRIAMDDAESYPWLILRPIRECVTWA